MVQQLPKIFSEPPHDLSIEQTVIGAMLLERHACPLVFEAFKVPEVFFLERHQLIYLAIQTLFQEGNPIDILTVTNELRRLGNLEYAGGAYYITELTTKVNSAANIEYHARILFEFWIKRCLINVSNINVQECHNISCDAFEILEKYSRQLIKITDQLATKKAYSGKEIFDQTISGIKKAMLTPGQSGIICGIEELDQITGGDHPTDLIITAARPGMGKTAYMMFRCCYVAFVLKRPVMIFSLEMSAEQLMLRLIASESEISSSKMRTGYTSDRDLAAILGLKEKLAYHNLIIDDTPGISILEMRAKAVAAKMKYPDLALIAMDYIQLASGSGGNREQEISSISRGLKKLAKELNIPIRALSQLSRSVETRGGDKRPQLSDLRESGAIEQDADVVEFLYRPEYYKINTYENGDSTSGHIDAIISKNRHGKLRDVTFGFNGSTMKFYSLQEKTVPIQHPDKFTQSGSIQDFENNPFQQ